MYWVYVLKSEKFEKSYVGQTDNLEKRLSQHNSGRTASTKRHIPWKIYYTEKFATRTEALPREVFLKSRNGRRFLKNVVFK